MVDQALANFLAQEQLPPAFGATVETVCRPLAELGRTLAERHGAARIGLAGPQGSGKSTIAEVTTRILQAQGLKAVAISLDDFYMPLEARREMAEAQLAPSAVRGPPGTHDVGMLLDVLDRLSRPGEVLLPAFDKGRDTVAPRSAWRTMEGPVAVTILEGWCVGAGPQPDEALAEPVNALERETDPQGKWRRRANEMLAGPYTEVWSRLHALAYLRPPGFEVVAGWRAEQEAKLRARTGAGMSDAEVVRFVAHYERLTRWMMTDLPPRADLVYRLDAQRRPEVYP